MYQNTDKERTTMIKLYHDEIKNYKNAIVKLKELRDQRWNAIRDIITEPEVFKISGMHLAIFVGYSNKKVNTWHFESEYMSRLAQDHGIPRDGMLSGADAFYDIFKCIYKSSNKELEYTSKVEEIEKLSCEIQRLESIIKNPNPICEDFVIESHGVRAFYKHNGYHGRPEYVFKIHKTDAPGETIALTSYKTDRNRSKNVSEIAKDLETLEQTLESRKQVWPK